MNRALEPQRWTGRRWLYTVAAVLAVQVAAIAVLVRRPSPPPVRPGFATRVLLATDPDSERRLASMPSVIDPALFALPSLHGFSGSAWLRYPLLDHTPVERVEPPEWLELDAARLGDEFLQLVASNTIAPRLLVDAPLPAVVRYEGNYPGDTLAPASRLRIEGPLAARPLAAPLGGSAELPSWPHSEMLSNTVVRAVVDAAGWTFSALIASRSGLAAADEHALRLVENARFRPSAGPGADYTWGEFVFLWHTKPLPLTNTLTVRP